MRADQLAEHRERDVRLDLRRVDDPPRAGRTERGRVHVVEVVHGEHGAALARHPLAPVDLEPRRRPGERAEEALAERPPHERERATSRTRRRSLTLARPSPRRAARSARTTSSTVEVGRVDHVGVGGRLHLRRRRARRAARRSVARRRRRRRAARPGGGARARPGRRRARPSRSASGQTTVPMSRPSTTASPASASSRWRLRMIVAHPLVPRDRRDDAVDASLPGSLPSRRARRSRRDRRPARPGSRRRAPRRAPRRRGRRRARARAR